VSDDERGDGGYVHRPGDTPGDASPDVESDAESDSFGARGWILVGVLTFSMLVVPGVIYLYPAAPGSAGLSFFAAMLALPMVPAVLLGLAAVWSMTAATRED
jgi:hypothetical protein